MKVTQEILDQLDTGFKVAAIWQNEELDDIGYQGDFSDTTCQQINNFLDLFISYLNNNQLEALYQDAEQFGHWLCLEVMGHGAGFYDSQDSVVSDISVLLEEKDLMYSFDNVYAEDGIIYIDFYKNF